MKKDCYQFFTMEVKEKLPLAVTAMGAEDKNCSVVGRFPGFHNLEMFLRGS